MSNVWSFLLFSSLLFDAGLPSFFLSGFFQTHCLCLTHHKFINSLRWSLITHNLLKSQTQWKQGLEACLEIFFTVNLLLDILIRRVNGRTQSLLFLLLSLLALTENTNPSLWCAVLELTPYTGLRIILNSSTRNMTVINNEHKWAQVAFCLNVLLCSQTYPETSPPQWFVNFHNSLPNSRIE